MENEFEEGVVSEQGYIRKSDEEIKKLALSLFNNEIFTSLQISDLNLLPMVFMPLALMNDITRKQLIFHEAYCFYAHMQDAGPRAINGYPMFFSVSYLNKEDTERMVAKFNAIKAAIENV